MSEKVTCDTCRELLPLLYAKSLSDKDEALTREHLEGCPKCRALLTEERPLYAAARVEGNLSPLADHPSGAQLDRYVHARSGLSSAELKELEGHLSKCGLCTELISNLSALPSELDDLVAGERLPLLSRLEVKPRPRVRIIDIGRRVFWRPLAGYAAAAAVLLIALLVHQAPIPQAIPTISGTISASSRGDKQTAIFFSTARACCLVLKYYVGPEPGHRYDMEIRSEKASWPSQVIRDYTDFDPQGNATLKTLVEIGEYRLVIYDIEGGDTIKIVKPFELKAQN